MAPQGVAVLVMGQFAAAVLDIAHHAAVLVRDRAVRTLISEMSWQSFT